MKTSRLIPLLLAGLLSLTSCPESFDYEGDFRMQNNDSRDIVTCVLKLDYHHAEGERSTSYSVHDLYDTVMHADKKDYEFAKIEQGQTKKFF